MQETWVQSLGGEDPLEEGMATHSSVLAWRIPMDRGAWWATDHAAAKSRSQLSDQAQAHSPKVFCNCFDNLQVQEKRISYNIKIRQFLKGSNSIKFNITAW